MSDGQISQTHPKGEELQVGTELKLNLGKGHSIQEVPVWVQRRPLLIAICLPIMLLLPFVNKAFHIDDTVFIWVARQIQDHPLDFFQLKQNWFGTLESMTVINKNPPGVSYLLASVMGLFGENEVWVHLAFLPIAVFISLGTFQLGRQIGLRPPLAALASACCVLTPVYVVSCSNIMSDPLMLAWYVWAVFLWIRGTNTRSFPLLIASGFCIAASVLTKYFGLSAVPLLLAYSVAHAYSSGQGKAFEGSLLPALFARLSPLLIPIAVAVLYQWWTKRSYGEGLLVDAANYAQQWRHQGGLSMSASLLVGLSFTGGCLLMVLCYAPVLWTRRGLSVGLGLAVVTGVLVCLVTLPESYPLHGPAGINAGFLLQWIVFAVAGLSIFALALADLRQRRDAAGVLLLCWIAGTFLFSAVANWTISARSIFPMAPAVGLLVARRVDGLLQEKTCLMLRRFMAPLLPAACLSFCVGWADYTLASGGRKTANVITRLHAGKPGDIWYAGHWGFQYYMEKQGGKPIDYANPRMAVGDLMVFPENNANVHDFSKEFLSPVEPTLLFHPCSWLSTMRIPVGAGFYSQKWGPLPYVFGPVSPETYWIYKLKLDRDGRPWSGGKD